MTTGRQFSATKSSHQEMLEYVLDQALSFGFVNTCHIELAVDEALSNVVTHSKSLNVEIACYQTQPSGIKIVIQDEGIPFNLFEHTKNDESSEGYGIDLILDRMDQVEYQRDSNHNILTLIKYLSD